MGSCGSDQTPSRRFLKQRLCHHACMSRYWRKEYAHPHVMESAIMEARLADKKHVSITSVFRGTQLCGHRILRPEQGNPRKGHDVSLQVLAG